MQVGRSNATQNSGLGSGSALVAWPRHARSQT